jgi:hypothetical protein
MLYRAPDQLPPSFENPSVFIAGGISNCPDWQTEIISVMNTEKFDVINPRRDTGFDKTGAIAEAQITWEHRALSMVDACVFWFPCETLCPITLFECGSMLQKAAYHSVQLVIGWHPEYQRAFDLEIQIGLRTDAKAHILHYGPGWDEFVSVVKKSWG